MARNDWLKSTPAAYKSTRVRTVVRRAFFLPEQPNHDRHDLGGLSLEAAHRNPADDLLILDEKVTAVTTHTRSTNIHSRPHTSRNRSAEAVAMSLLAHWLAHRAHGKAQAVRPERAADLGFCWSRLSESNR